MGSSFKNVVYTDYINQPTEIEPTEADFREAEKLAMLWAEGKLPQNNVESDSTFVARRYNETILPEELSISESKVFHASPFDFQWAQSYFQNIPEYLSRYYANRYVSLCKKQGNKVANTFLRKKMGPAKNRVLVVLKRYQALPDTYKVSSIKNRLEDIEVDEQISPVPKFKKKAFTSSTQREFDFEKAEKSNPPEKRRILAEVEKDELKDMAFVLSNNIVQLQNYLTKTTDCDTNGGAEIAHLMVARESIAVIRKFGIAPPKTERSLKPENVIQTISKMRCEKWWFRKLVRARKMMREHLAIAMGQVSSKASPYASWDCIREYQDQKKANWEAINNMSLWDEETEEEIDLADMVLKSQANPAIRRHELMTRTRGFEDIADAMGLQGLFFTLTAPSKYHSSYKKGGFINHWNGASPADTQNYLNKVWQKIRAKMSNAGLRWFGVRVAEPHHDGTPHWHLLIWASPSDVLRITDIFIRYATATDREELEPENYALRFQPIANYVEAELPEYALWIPLKVHAKNFPVTIKKHRPNVALPESVQVYPIVQEGLTTLNIDYTPRCDVGFIDPEEGTATGYIAKYISKNIDGYKMDNEVSDETGKPVREMAVNVSAWASRWNLRQFQFFGGAPVTTYRELRRYANLDKAGFLQNVALLDREQMLQLYREITYSPDFVGAPLPDHLLKPKELIKRLSDSYQPTIESKSGDVVQAMQSADSGDWHGYVMGQGGPFVKRDDLLIRNMYETLPFASPHGEDVKKIKGFKALGDEHKTRLRIWTIKPKQQATTSSRKEYAYEFDKPTENPSTWKLKKRLLKVDNTAEVEASTQGSAATAIGASGSSRSSVNNCTGEHFSPSPLQDTNKVERPLDPLIELEIRRLSVEYDLDDQFRSELIKGRWLILEKNKSIKLRLGDGQRCPDNLVYRNDVDLDLSWLGEPEEDEPILLTDSDDDYIQPDLSWF